MLGWQTVRVNSLGKALDMADWCSSFSNSFYITFLSRRNQPHSPDLFACKVLYVNQLCHYMHMCTNFMAEVRQRLSANSYLGLSVRGSQARQTSSAFQCLVSNFTGVKRQQQESPDFWLKATAECPWNSSLGDGPTDLLPQPFH